MSDFCDKSCRHSFAPRHKCNKRHHSNNLGENFDRSSFVCDFYLANTYPEVNKRRIRSQKINTAGSIEKTIYIQASYQQ